MAHIPLLMAISAFGLGRKTLEFSTVLSTLSPYPVASTWLQLWRGRDRSTPRWKTWQSRQPFYMQQACHVGDAKVCKKAKLHIVHQKRCWDVGNCINIPALFPSHMLIGVWLRHWRRVNFDCSGCALVLSTASGGRQLQSAYCVQFTPPSTVNCRADCVQKLDKLWTG